MIGAIRKFSDVINTVYTWAGVVFLAYCIFAVTTQVVTRYVFNASQGWTEETARYAFIWLNILGATIAVKHRGSPAVDLIQSLLPKKAQKGLGFIIRLLILYCAVIMIIYGVQLVLMTGGQLSSAARVPMQLVFAAVPLGGIGIFVHSAADILDDITGLRQKKGEEV
jgi:TRAP-type C4-dicarboxylate transport system permease small subunit